MRMKKLSVMVLLLSFMGVLFAQKNVTVDEAKALIKKEKKLIVVDVRTPREFEAFHLDNAIMIDYYSPTFKQDLAKLSKKQPILLYCRTGRRSGEALQMMKEMGYTKVYNMLGGITQWK